MTHRFRTVTPRNNTQAGYGSSHMKERKRRLPLTSPTDPCAHCGRPLGPERLPGEKVSRWHLPHNDTRTGYLPGFAHARCNIIDGARRGNQRQRAARQPQRNWYRPTPHPITATGTCVICGTAFEYSHADQKTCSRACGWSWRRMNTPPKPPTPGRTVRQYRYTRECQVCSRSFGTNRERAVTCGRDCSRERSARLMRERYRARQGLPSTADLPVRRRS